MTPTHPKAVRQADPTRRWLIAAVCVALGLLAGCTIPHRGHATAALASPTPDSELAVTRAERSAPTPTSFVTLAKAAQPRTTVPSRTAATSLSTRFAEAAQSVAAAVSAGATPAIDTAPAAQLSSAALPVAAVRGVDVADQAQLRSLGRDNAASHTAADTPSPTATAPQGVVPEPTASILPSVTPTPISIVPATWTPAPADAPAIGVTPVMTPTLPPQPTATPAFSPVETSTLTASVQSSQAAAAESLEVVSADKSADKPASVHARVLEDLVVAAVNAERAARNLPPYEVDPQLSQVARAHAADMVTRNYFSHVTPEGATLHDRLSDAGLAPYWAGENIQWNTGEKEAAVTQAIKWFMGSAPHRSNILHSHYDHIGVGVVVNDAASDYYTATTFTLVFAALADGEGN